HPEYRNARRGPGQDANGLDALETIDVAFHQQCLLETGRDVWIEPARFGVGGDRFLEQTAISARVPEAGKEIRIVAVTSALTEQAHHALFGATGVGFEVRIILVRHRESRVQRDRAPEGFLFPYY